MRGRSRPARDGLQGWGVITPDDPLDPALAAGSVALSRLALCDVRLQLDARFPWLILIPRVPRARELENLPRPDRQRLMDEVVLAGRVARVIGATLGRPVEKLNMGSLGNITPQLHVHVVGRRRDDAAWPGPVWGVSGSIAYTRPQLALVIAAAQAGLSEPFGE